MALTGNYGGELDAIHCDVMSVDVVTRADDGSQIMGRVGLAIEIKPDLTPGIPEECPLTKLRGFRELANFAVCTQCSHSILEDPNGVEC